MTGAAPMDRRAAQLREAFDRTFAVAPPAGEGERIDLLAITVGGLPYALRMSEVGAVVACRKIAPLPSRRAELLGAAGVRGNLVIVYSLDALLGERSGRERTPVSWLAIYKHAEGVAFGFAQVEGILRVPAGNVHPIETPNEGRKSANHAVVRLDEGVRSIVDLSVAVSMTTRGVAASPHEER